MGDVKRALERCAVGLCASEVVEEFSADGNGELKLVKKKITKKEIPPDIKAVKMLLEGDSYLSMSDEELICERERLTNILKEDEGD